MSDVRRQPDGTLVGPLWIPGWGSRYGYTEETRTCRERSVPMPGGRIATEREITVHTRHHGPAPQAPPSYVQPSPTLLQQLWNLVIVIAGIAVAAVFGTIGWAVFGGRMIGFLAGVFLFACLCVFGDKG